MKHVQLSISLLLAMFLLIPAEAISQKQNKKDKIEQPEYPGGLSALHKFIQSEIRYPDEARRNNEMGEVLVGFTVGIDGHLTGVRVLRSVSKSLNEEAVRVVSKTGYWYPGKKNGKPVRFEMSIPIHFKVFFEHDKFVNEEGDGSTVTEDVLKEIF